MLPIGQSQKKLSNENGGRKPLSKEYEQMISHFMTNLKKEIKENRNQFDEVPDAKKIQ